MDSEKYWQAFERGTAIAVAADVARACLLSVGQLASEAHADLNGTRGSLAELRNDPNRRGAVWSRSALNIEITRLERDERRQAMRLEALRQHETRHHSELSQLAPQRESTTRLLDQITGDYEAMHATAAREPK